MFYYLLILITSAGFYLNSVLSRERKMGGKFEMIKKFEVVIKIPSAFN